MTRHWLLLPLLLGFSAFGAEEAAFPVRPLTNETEVGIVIASGNSDTETYTARHFTAYSWDGNLAKIFGRYLLGKTSGATTAESWEVGARYERDLTPDLAVFAQYRLDRNSFAGLDLRHAIDGGGKYYFVREEGRQFFNETGYRFTSEDRLGPTVTVDSHFVRVYFEYNRALGDLITAKIGLELLPNLSTANDYQANLEISMLASLSPIFSLKTGYLVQYRNQPAGVGKKRLDSLFTTSLVAKF
jgi:putative salt-induced outer membrane protein